MASGPCQWVRKAARRRLRRLTAGTGRRVGEVRTRQPPAAVVWRDLARKKRSERVQCCNFIYFDYTCPLVYASAPRARPLVAGAARSLAGVGREITSLANEVQTTAATPAIPSSTRTRQARALTPCARKSLKALSQWLGRVPLAPKPPNLPRSVPLACMGRRHTYIHA